jgi:hypothetical protein
MVRELKLQGCIECMEPQAVFSFLFGDERFVKRYHKEQNEDPYAEVSSWTADCCRTVKFAAPVDAPNVIKKVIGVDNLKVTETQSYSREGNSFTVKSEPTVDHPKGFNTTAEMILANAENGKGCAVSITATLECKAAVWGVQGTIENFMESRARKSFLGWLKLARVYCKEQLTLATGDRGREEEDLPEMESSEDEFFDFSEEDEKALSLSGESRTLGDIYSQGGEDGLQNWLRHSVTRQLNGLHVTCDALGDIYSQEGEDGLQNWLRHSVTRQLNGLHITCDASRSHVQELNRRLQKMEDILMVQQQLQHGFYLPYSVFWSFLGLGLATGVLFGAGHIYLIYRRSI